MIHFFQSSVQEVSQSQHGFEVRERRFGDGRAAVEECSRRVRGHARGGALADLFVFVAAERTDAAVRGGTLRRRRGFRVRQTPRDQRAAFARCTDVAAKHHAIPSFAALVGQHARVRADVFVTLGDVHEARLVELALRILRQLRPQLFGNRLRQIVAARGMVGRGFVGFRGDVAGDLARFQTGHDRAGGQAAVGQKVFGSLAT